MRDRESAFAILGLRPGAPRAEVDQAYRRLIKRHHPDHAGGDSGRAAEINQAYAQLRRLAAPPAPMETRGPPVPLPRARRRGTVSVALAGVALIASLLLLVLYESPANDPSWSNISEEAAPARPAGSEAARLARSEGLDEPISEALVDQSVADALRMHAEGDASVMADFSRACLSRLRQNPTLQRFDSCAAYDEALGILETTSAGFDSGAFNPSAVTARQVGAARLLSSDYLSAESRLQQIRSRVHLTLLPQLPDGRRAAQIPVQTRSEIVGARQPPRRVYRPTAPVLQRRLAPVQPQAAPGGPVAQSAPAVRQTAAAPQQPKPSPPAAAPPPPPEIPAWQKPLQPAWQRPLPNPSPGN